MSKVVMVMGLPASGKSSVSKKFIQQGYFHLNRDLTGGKVIDLLPKMKHLLSEGKNIVLDNIFAKPEDRKPFIEAADEIDAIYMDTKAEDCSINALCRQWKMHGRLFYSPEDFKNVNDPNTFPIVVIFKYKKEWVKPTKEEGFNNVGRAKFVRQPWEGNNKALFFDYDDTVRTVIHEGKYKFPTKIDEVQVLPNRAEILKNYKSQGYYLLGVSNQSGIARVQLTEDDAIACFEETNKQLGGIVDDYKYCPHNIPPKCYCIKPQSGLGIELIMKYNLDPIQCIMVGDQTIDKTFAKRLGMTYYDVNEFFD